LNWLVTTLSTRTKSRGSTERTLEGGEIHHAPMSLQPKDLHDQCRESAQLAVALQCNVLEDLAESLGVGHAPVDAKDLKEVQAGLRQRNIHVGIREFMKVHGHPRPHCKEKSEQEVEGVDDANEEDEDTENSESEESSSSDSGMDAGLGFAK